MIQKNNLRELLVRINVEIKKIFNEKLEEVILFGSYADGRQDEESDIDIMILVDMESEDLQKYLPNVVQIINELDLEYDVVISPILQDYKQFLEYRDVLPFFKNVSKGVKISA